jgi:hypothetical protein
MVSITQKKKIQKRIGRSMFYQSRKGMEIMRVDARPCWIFNEVVASLDTYTSIQYPRILIMFAVILCYEQRIAGNQYFNRQV